MKDMLFILQVVKVCDFGVARMLPSSGFRDKGGPTDQLKHTEMTAETGTYRWMAPEVDFFSFLTVFGFEVLI